VGAGDTFDAGFLYGYRRGWEVVACLAYGSATASLYISRPADRFPDRPAVEAAAAEYGIALPHRAVGP
jgi:5-dehydro-2-deoxygluconokinase